MTDRELERELKAILSQAYPNAIVKVGANSEQPVRRVVEFTDESFRPLFPRQRYHRLVHLIPEDFCNQYLAESEWMELAPGETPEDLEYPDDELIESISPDVLRHLKSRGFFEKLDEAMLRDADAATRSICSGDFSISKSILSECGFPK